MFEPSHLGHMLALAVGALQLVQASCPYAHGNQARDTVAAIRHPEAVLEPRYNEDADFGRCARKSKVAGGGTRSADWWPCQLNLAVLRQNSDQSNPLGGDFDYPTEFAKLDPNQLKQDITELQTSSQSWWPADFGNYGPFFVRMAWHSAGTYRAIDGRGGSGMGQQRFAVLNSWPDNASLDKARRLLWPIKQKYGNKLSWADLIAYTGHLCIDNMGVPTHGFGFGRVDTWQADEGIYWGSEMEIFPKNGSNTGRYNGSTDLYGRATGLEAPLADTDMGLIYVDPRGPNGVPDPRASALDSRMTFGRMGMDDEETVALIAGGHAFGKTHGAIPGSTDGYIGPEPNAAGIEMQGLGWDNTYPDNATYNKYTSGLEVIWTDTPLKWTNTFLNSLLKNNWTLVHSPDGAPQYEAENADADVPDAFIPGKFHKPRILTSDLALREDPIYYNISKTFANDFNYFTEKFAAAWYKLLHRDMGPISRYMGPEVPTTPPRIWQDPLPTVNYSQIDDNDVKQLKQQILAAPGLNISNLVTTAWGSASTFRISDKRGGANGGRIALDPQRSFGANNPQRLQSVLEALGDVQNKFNSANKSKQVSLADLIVLGGSAAVEKAAQAAGMPMTVPFRSGRVDTTQELTDVGTFAYLEPQADGFRNYGVGNQRSTTEELLVDRASLLTLTPPEMTVLIGGMRALDANYDGSEYGVFTERPGTLTNDYFVNLLNISTSWSPIDGTNNEFFQGKDYYSGQPKYTATRTDLVFGSHPELRAIAEVYGAADAEQKFVNDFIQAWSKVMDLDRYDIKGRKQNNVQ